MSELSSRIVQKLWSYCNVLRDDGLSYQDYLEQLTYILFLKMADERATVTAEAQAIPKGYRWSDLTNPAIEGVRLEEHYRETLRKLGEAGGMLGLIFRKAQNKIQDPAKLRQIIVELIGKEDWLAMSSDVKGEAYEGLLERNAQDIKSGAGQYFTPRPVIAALVDCIQPHPGEVIVDPACGTGGFLLAAHVYSPTISSSTATRRSTSSSTPAWGRDRGRRQPPLRDEPFPPWGRSSTSSST
jgi:type I restriction enzyme M protein